MALAVAIVVIALTIVVFKYWRRTSERQRIIERAAQEQAGCRDDGEDWELPELTTEEAGVRRVKRQRRGHFRNYLVREGKAKFGVPNCTEANRLTVRKYLYDLCREHGLVARHIAEHLDIATSLVFVPTEVEILAAAITHTAESTTAMEQHRLFRSNLNVA